MHKAIERKEPIILDSTLREGFQTPGGIGASLEERVYAAALVQRYANWLELGMPANNVDYEIITAIKKRFLQEKYPVGIAVLARCDSSDIDRSAKVMAGYPNSLIHLFLGTSDEHRMARFGGEKNEGFYKSLIMESVENASSRKEFSRIMFTPEDSYRTFMQNPDRLNRFIEAAKRGYSSGNKRINRSDALVINLADTVGCSTVYEFWGMLDSVKKRFGDSIDLSVHAHNDSGMAQAITIDAYERSGVQWLQTTFAQLGERNGIASTDLTIKILADKGYIRDNRIASKENLKQLDPITRAVLRVFGRELPEEHLDRKNVSTSGVHTQAVAKHPSAYHIFLDKFGSPIEIELGPTSGSKQVMRILDEYKVKYPKEGKQIGEFVDALKSQANERKSPLSITHILYEAQIRFNGWEADGGLRDIDYKMTTAKNGKTMLEMEGYIDNEYFKTFHRGNGPVEAAMILLNRIINKKRGIKTEITLESYKTRPIPIIGKKYLNWEVGSSPEIPTQIGKTAYLAVSLALRNGGEAYYGWARSRNSTIAKIEAVIDGMTKMYALQKWQSPH